MALVYYGNEGHAHLPVLGSLSADSMCELLVSGSPKESAQHNFRQVSPLLCVVSLVDQTTLVTAVFFHWSEVGGSSWPRCTCHRGGGGLLVGALSSVSHKGLKKKLQSISQLFFNS